MEQPHFISIDFNYSGQKRASHFRTKNYILLISMPTHTLRWHMMSQLATSSMTSRSLILNVFNRIRLECSHQNALFFPCKQIHEQVSLFEKTQHWNNIFLSNTIQQMPLFAVSLCHKSSMVICLTNDAYNLFQWTQIVLHMDKNNELKETKDVPCHSSMIIWQKFTQ